MFGFDVLGAGVGVGQLLLHLLVGEKLLVDRALVNHVLFPVHVHFVFHGIMGGF